MDMPYPLYLLPLIAGLIVAPAQADPLPSAARPVAPAGATARPLSAYLNSAPTAATPTSNAVTPAPAAATAPAVSSGGVVAASPRAALPTTPATTPPANEPAALGGQTPPPAPPVITPEQRHQQELLANADRVDKINRDLLAEKQKMALQLEQLETQVNVLKMDRSNEGIRDGALAVIAGFLLGWFFASSRKSNW